VLRTSQRNYLTTDSADAPPVNSREFEDAIGGLKYDIRQLTEYYDGLVETRRFVLRKVARD
jgi:hypothetical protein